MIISHPADKLGIASLICSLISWIQPDLVTPASVFAPLTLVMFPLVENHPVVALVNIGSTVVLGSYFARLWGAAKFMRVFAIVAASVSASVID